MKRTTAIILVLLLGAAIMTGCASKKEKILGIWRFKSSYSGTMTIMLFKNMKFMWKYKASGSDTTEREMGNYTLNGDRITLKFRDGRSRQFDIKETESDALHLNDLDKNTGGMKMFKKINRF